MQRVSITGNSTNLFSSQTAGGGLFEAAEAVGDKGEEEQKRGVLEVDASIRGRWEEDDDDDDNDDEAMQHYCLSRARSLFTQADGYRSKMQFQKPQTQPPVLDPTNSLLSGLLLLHQGPTCAPELHRKRRFCMYFKAQREREKGREGAFLEAVPVWMLEDIEGRVFEKEEQENLQMQGNFFGSFGMGAREEAGVVSMGRRRAGALVVVP
ncbi:unnamed protein product [Sphagnum jensenii]|uniref:Uncharacterized protein n=1 Tax=Sphagnum jensenii TaxID=128206 RepID=A0ABP0WNL1_9BRYO